MVRLLSNQSWFNIKIEGGSEFGVYSLKGYERLNEPYEFEIELVSPEEGIDLLTLLRSPALLTMHDNSGGKRLVHGSVREAQQLHTANRFTHYKIWLAPRLWYLGLNQEHRIFQNKTVVNIISEVLKKQGFPDSEVAWKMRESYEKREFCVQYGESDLHFISRLCEEEGLYFWFEHKESSHTLCFSDASGGPYIAGEDKGGLRFFPGSGQLADSAVISRINLRQRINSDKAAYREWNFEQPSLDLEASQFESSNDKAPVPGGLNLEKYQYPHLYDLRKPGDRYAELQVLRQLTYAKWVDGQSDVTRLLPGFAFTLSDHSRKDLNDLWWLTEVRHFGEQPQVLEDEAPDRGFSYHNSFEAVPFEVRFLPALKHPKMRIIGDQTAIVTGPGSEEISPDKYGRVTVKFHWDRRDFENERNSCQIRVSQGWAGGEFGTMAIPRVGQEVIVSFLEGDPDRPLITGRVYNGALMPPYELPAHKTRTVFKSLSSPGGGGFNELRIEDKKGEEEIYVHAEKDLNARIKNDWKEQILNDQHRTVEKFSYSHIKGEDHQMVDQPRKIELMTSDHLTVHGDSHTEVKSKWLAKAGDEIHFKSGSKVVIEAGLDLTIKAGSHFIRITPAGIFTSVPFNMGAGSPADGTGAAPLLPSKSEAVPASKVPPTMICSCRKAAGMPFVEIG